MEKTNKEHYGPLPLTEALAKHIEDYEKGLLLNFEQWLEHEYLDPSVNYRIYKGKCYLEEDVLEKIRQFEQSEVVGYLLEWQTKDGGWMASEFDPINLKSTYWGRWDDQDAIDDWFDHEVEVGFFADLPNAWYCGSDDWDDRLGVDFDSRTTPHAKPSPIDVWGGVSSNDGQLWRVRKVKISGKLSENAKAFFLRNPRVAYEYAGE